MYTIILYWHVGTKKQKNYTDCVDGGKRLRDHQHGNSLSADISINPKLKFTPLPLPRGRWRRERGSV
ncbi:hypothetical protein L0Y69_02275, partial [bacterium]|nr:hypothetical protein [bacterium]